MKIEEYLGIVRAFERAFGDAQPPLWSDCKPLEAIAVLQSIASIAANPLNKHNRCKAGLVIRRATAKRPPCKPSQRPWYPRTEATK